MGSAINIMICPNLSQWISLILVKQQVTEQAIFRSINAAASLKPIGIQLSIKIGLVYSAALMLRPH